jgi:hypothetical protein
MANPSIRMTFVERWNGRTMADLTEQQRAYLQRYDDFDKEPLDIHLLMKVTQQMAGEWKKNIKISIDGDILRVTRGVSSFNVSVKDRTYRCYVSETGDLWDTACPITSEMAFWIVTGRVTGRYKWPIA